MAVPYLGEICALAAALTWATALVLFKRSGESIPPLSLCLFKNVVAIVLLGGTLSVEMFYGPLLGGLDRAGALSADAPTATWVTQLHEYDVYILILSGVLGIAIADTLLFYSLNLIGVGLVTVVECTYTPFVMATAWLFLFEHIATADILGGAMVLSGVFISSTHKPPAGRTRRRLLWGMSLGVLAILLMAIGIVFAKPVLAHTTLLAATMWRLVGGTGVLAMLLASSPNRRRHFAVFRPSAAWRTCVPASILGTYFAMIFWLAGFKYTTASVAAVLNQTSTILALIMATLILKEPFTRRKALAALLAFAGVVVVSAF